MTTEILPTDAQRNALTQAQSDVTTLANYFGEHMEAFQFAEQKIEDDDEGSPTLQIGMFSLNYSEGFLNGKSVYGWSITATETFSSWDRDYPDDVELIEVFFGVNILDAISKLFALAIEDARNYAMERLGEDRYEAEMADSEAEAEAHRSCGCPDDYHMADCPILTNG